MDGQEVSVWSRSVIHVGTCIVMYQVNHVQKCFLLWIYYSLCTWSSFDNGYLILVLRPTTPCIVS